MAPFILLTPSNRGLSLALLHHLLQTPSKTPILATTRTPSPALNELASSHSRLHIQPLDVHSEKSISTCADYARSTFSANGSRATLRTAFVLPGVLDPEKSVRKIDAESAERTLKTNLLGPMLVCKHFEAFLPGKTDAKDEGEGKAVMTLLAARVGSTSDNRLGGWYSYRASKAGLISFAKAADIEVQRRCAERACVVAYHPGTVKTELSRRFWGGVEEGKLFEPERAAGYLVEQTERVERDVEGMRGRCWDWKGEEVRP
ncbi:MAG: hypothetical protein M1814_004690 [Vezdaea aestivalis]|nr:MAG: hypothetical protein M1814_004690 [Vezdaea aestivalis]